MLGDYFVPFLDVNICTCILFFGIQMLEEVLCLTPHSWFSSINVAFSSLTNTSKKFVDVDGPFPFFLEQLSSICPMPKQKEHFKP